MKMGIFLLIIGLAAGALLGYFYGHRQGQVVGQEKAAAEFYSQRSEEIPENPIENVGYENPFAGVNLNPFSP